MADIDIQPKKRPVWPWILGIIAVIIVIWLLVRAMNNNNDNNMNNDNDNDMNGDTTTRLHHNHYKNAVWYCEVSVNTYVA